MTSYVCLQGKVRWQFSKIFVILSLGGQQGLGGKNHWSCVSNRCFHHSGGSMKFTEKAVSPSCYLPAMWHLQRHCWKGKVFFFIVILFGMTDKPLAPAKEVETLGGLCWLAVSRQGHDRKTGDVAQSYGVNPITLPACIRFWHFRCLVTSHLALR